MSSSHNTGQSLPSNDTVVVPNAPVRAESGLSGVSPSASGDLAGDRSTQTNEVLNRTAGGQQTTSTDDQATDSRVPSTDEQASQRGLNSGSASLGHNNASGLRQQRPATAPTAGSSQTDIQASAQQQAHSGTSSAYPPHRHLPNLLGASRDPAFDKARAAWIQELHMECLTTQYAVERTPYENAVDYERYFNVR